MRERQDKLNGAPTSVKPLPREGEVRVGGCAERIKTLVMPQW